MIDAQQELRYIFFHHQTTTNGHFGWLVRRCVISSFITKPQLQYSMSVDIYVALYLLSSPNHNNCRRQSRTAALRYIFFHHQTTTVHLLCLSVPLLRYIFFHHQTTTLLLILRVCAGCVISSFITKPQLLLCCSKAYAGCVISSFITKPQPEVAMSVHESVALYLLSSPNHNWKHHSHVRPPLRYIFFHHQTTTRGLMICGRVCCVISSFITKPQLAKFNQQLEYGCVISSFITKPQLFDEKIAMSDVALYLLSSPNHNCGCPAALNHSLRYIFFHHQTTTAD